MKNMLVTLTMLAGMFLSFNAFAWEPFSYSVELACKTNKAGNGTIAISGTVAEADSTHARSTGAGTILGQVIPGVTDANIASLNIPCSQAEAIINANVLIVSFSCPVIEGLIAKFFISPTTTFPMGSSGVVITRWNGVCLYT